MDQRADQPLAANRAAFGPSSEWIVVNKISRAIALDLFNEARSREIFQKSAREQICHRRRVIATYNRPIDSDREEPLLSFSLFRERRVSLIAHVASRGERKKTSVAADTHFLSPR